MTVSRCSSHSRRSVPALSRNCRCALNGACASRSSPHCRQASSQNVAPISGLHAGYFHRARRLPATPGRYLFRIAQFRLLLPDLWMVSGGHRRHQGMRCRGQSRLWRQCRVRTGAAQSRPLVLRLSARSRWSQAHNAHRAPDVGVLHFHLQVWAQQHLPGSGARLPHGSIEVANAARAAGVLVAVLGVARGLDNRTLLRSVRRCRAGPQQRHFRWNVGSVTGSVDTKFRASDRPSFNKRPMVGRELHRFQYF